MPPLIYLTIAWIAGIAAAKWFEPPAITLLVLAIPAMVALLLYRKEPRPRFIALNALAFLLGAGRLLIAQPAITPAHIAWYNDGDSLTLTAKIIDEPDVRDTYTNLRVAAQRIRLKNGDESPVEGLVLLRTARYPEYHYGDTLEIFGKPETPPVFEGFSYKDYLARFGIHSMMRRGKITLLRPQTGFSLYTGIYRFKEKAHQVINRILSEPEAALLNGILLGIQSGIPRDLYDQFNATGASHVIVISGSNISLLVGLLLLAGQKAIGKRSAFFLALAGVTVYTAMVGADAAVVRAALMGVLFILAMYVGRPNVVLNTLFVSALAMTLYNPLTLWDVGFQLSFLATLGLVTLVSPLEHGAATLLNRLGVTSLPRAAGVLNEALLVTIAAQIITTPLIVYQFGRFSVVSLLTNFLIVPVQPLVMIFGGLATLAGLIWLPLGQLVAWAAWLPLAWTIWMVQWTANFRWAQFELPAMPFWLMALLYLTLAAAVWAIGHPAERRRLSFSRDSGGGVKLPVLGLAAGLLLLLWAATQHLPDGKLHVAFLDIGQGDAILVTTPNGRQILIDGGPSPAKLGQRLGEEMPFWDRSIDVVISTHPDADHITGLVEALDRYRIDTILISDADSSSSLFDEWNERLQAHAYRPTLAWQGMRLRLDKAVEAIVLNPGPAVENLDSPNDHSVTLKLTMDAVSFLLSGDAEIPAEQAMINSGQDLRATVLKSPHHGSKTGSSAAFLEAVNPQIVVISVGKENRFGHPAPEVLQRYADYGITVLRTDKLGTVTLITDGKQLWLETSK